MPAKPKTKVGTVEALLKGRTPVVRKWTLAALKAVRAAVPKASSRVYRGWRVIAFSTAKIEPGKPAEMSKMFCGVCPMKDSVGIYFFHSGAKLPDPAGLLAGGGKGMRSVKINAKNPLRAVPLKKLVQAAAKLAAR